HPASPPGPFRHESLPVPGHGQELHASLKKAESDARASADRETRLEPWHSSFATAGGRAVPTPRGGLLVPVGAAKPVPSRGWKASGPRRPRRDSLSPVRPTRRSPASPRSDDARRRVVPAPSRDDAARLRELLSAVEHELRGPLGAIATWVHVLSTSGEGAAREQGLAAIDRSVKSATRLLDDLHDLKQLAEGRVGLKRAPVDLWPLLQSAARKVASTAEDRTIRLPAVAVEGAVVSGDADRLARVVETLLVNAIALAGPGGVVEARLERAGRFWQVAIAEPER